MSDLLQRWVHDTVSALAYSFAHELKEPAPAETGSPRSVEAFNDLTQFVLRQQAQMPDYLRPLMRIATTQYDMAGLAGLAGLFHSRSPERRRKEIQAWRNSRYGFKRDLMRYYESLVTLAFFSRDAAALTTETGTGSTQPGGLSAPTQELRYEIAVIGSGPGGAITACLLAEAGRKVLLMEEGPFYQLESCEPFSRDEMLQKYRNGGQTVAFGKSKVAYVEGRCVGGGSEINSGLYHRTPPEILEQWRKEFQVEGLTEADLVQHFQACEVELSVSLMRGSPSLAALRLHEGATRLGWKCFEVPRWFRYESEGSGSRQSMSKTFIPRFLEAGGHLLPHARVQRLSNEGSRWRLTGQCTGGHSLRVEAENVFVCAGAIQTPALLRRSGIRQNIGDSLQMHPTVKVVAQFAEPVNAKSMGVPTHQVKEFSPRLSLGCSISSPAYVALGLLDHPEQIRELPANWERMANYYAMITPQGRGTVRTLKRFADPLVRFGLTNRDQQNLADGLRKLCESLFQGGAVEIFPGVTGARPLRSADDLVKLPGALPEGLANLMTIHLFSSCPMGEDKKKCATDSFGRVHGHKNLFVADASLLCTAPGVNPQGSIMALARRNALQFLRQS